MNGPGISALTRIKGACVFQYLCLASSDMQPCSGFPLMNLRVGGGKKIMKRCHTHQESVLRNRNRES
jgi:hypothetical protein